jgi:type I restriction enzyme R subunit
MLVALRETNAIPVRERWKPLEQLTDEPSLQQWHAATKSELLTVAAPLMHLIPIRGEEAARRFDLLMTRLQAARLRGIPSFDDLKARVEEHVERLQMNLNPVRAKADAIKSVRSKEFWASASYPELESLRNDLRGIMKHQDYPTTARRAPRVLNLEDGNVSRELHVTTLVGLDLVEYRTRVKKALLEHFETNLTLRKIRSSIRVSDQDVRKLAELVLQVDPDLDLNRLFAAGRSDLETTVQDRLQFTLRSVVGLDTELIERAFTAFVHTHPRLSARQIQFLTLLKNHLGEHGMLTLEQLDQPPFTDFDAAGIDGVFPDEDQVDRLLEILAQFDPANVQASTIEDIEGKRGMNA